MKRSLLSLLALALSFTLATLLTVTTKSSVFSETYPEVVCPPTLNGLSSQISIASRKTAFQRLATKSTKTIPFNVLRYPEIKDSLIVSALGTTPVIWQSRSGSWAGGTLCTGPISSQWFVGGSSDVRTRGNIVVINSGLSAAIIDLHIYSENGKQPLVSINVAAKSLKVISLDSLATGDKSLTVQVVPRSGRINAFMIDELGAGLKALGGDLVNPVNSTAKTLVIPAIPNQILKRGETPSAAHILRILAPADVDANFTLELLSENGTFVPVGFNSRNITAGVVTEFVLSPKIVASSFAVRITSDEPIVAAISSKFITNGRRDFVWSTPTSALTPMKMAVTGLSPIIVFAADSIAVTIEVALVNGKRSIVTIKGRDVATWRVPKSARSITIIEASRETYAGALVASIHGYGYLPITPGSILAKVEIPHSNIRVLNP
ncbi:MAG: DUF5719 family protein [Candidatus Planktophila sp.]|nr:DUF5719 family protein [Candidatus Planktophila sp.]